MMVCGVYSSSGCSRISAASGCGMCARKTLPADVACSGVRLPTQSMLVMAALPSTWSMLMTASPS